MNARTAATELLPPQIAFLAGGKDGAFDARLEAMAKALAALMSAKWYRWQVRLV